MPREEVPRLMEAAHDHVTSGHVGVFGTHKKLQKRFFWFNMYSEIENYVKSCDQCQRNKVYSALMRNGELRSVFATRPLELVGLDLMGELKQTRNGNKFLAVFVDYLTRWVVAVPIRDMKATTIADAFVKRVCLHYGVPEAVVTDSASELIGKVLSNMSKMLGTRRVAITPYNHQGNGLVERNMRSFQEAIKPYLNETQDNWDEIVDYSAFALNTKASVTNQASPFYLLFGYEPRLPIESELKEFLRQDLPPGTEVTREIAEKVLLARKLALDQEKRTKDKLKEKYDKRANLDAFELVSKSTFTYQK